MKQMLIIAVLVFGTLSGCADYYRGVAKMSGFQGDPLPGLMTPAPGQPFPLARERTEARP